MKGLKEVKKQKGDKNVVVQSDPLLQLTSILKNSNLVTFDCFSFSTRKCEMIT